MYFIYINVYVYICKYICKPLIKISNKRFIVFGANLQVRKENTVPLCNMFTPKTLHFWRPGLKASIPLNTHLESDLGYSNTSRAISILWTLAFDISIQIRNFGNRHQYLDGVILILKFEKLLYKHLKTMRKLMSVQVHNTFLLWLFLAL